jgi:hypothetical protein
MRSFALALAAVALFSTGGTLACREQGPAERAGEAIDEAADDAEEAAEDAGEAIEDTAEDLRE